jgi:hypothetical protein
LGGISKQLVELKEGFLLVLIVLIWRKAEEEESKYSQLDYMPSATFI